MYHLYLDPILFACPPSTEGQKGFDSFLRGILLLRDLKEDGWAQLFTTTTTSDALFEAGMYPLQNSLFSAIQSFATEDDKEVIQARDIVEIVNSLLQKVPTLESYLGVDALLFDELVTFPALDLSERPNSLKHCFEDILSFCVLIADLKSQPNEKQILVSRNLNSPPRKVSVEGEILELEGLLKLALPYEIVGECWLCQSWDDMHSCLDPNELWITEPLGTFQRQALSTHAARLLKESGDGTTTVQNWNFGPKFFTTAGALGFLHSSQKAKTVLRACAETILRLNLQFTHPLRIGHGPNDPQKMRGKDKAWRRDIDYEFHLHYWETPLGIEFGSVVIHNDFTIPE
jgi:hypothetical protein